MKSILNIGAGKIDLKLNYDFLVNLDLMYEHFSRIQDIEFTHDSYDFSKKVEMFCKEDVFKFLETCKIKFDRIIVYRFLEHVEFTKVLYFIYLLSTSLKDDGLIDVIVPDYDILCRKLIQEYVHDLDFEKNNIILTTEMLNEPSSPHASIWTASRAKYFFEFEGRLEVKEIKTPFVFDGRNIYLRFIAQKVNFEEPTQI